MKSDTPDQSTTGHLPGSQFGVDGGYTFLSYGGEAVNQYAAGPGEVGGSVGRKVTSELDLPRDPGFRLVLGGADLLPTQWRQLHPLSFPRLTCALAIVLLSMNVWASFTTEGQLGLLEAKELLDKHVVSLTFRIHHEDVPTSETVKVFVTPGEANRTKFGEKYLIVDHDSGLQAYRIVPAVIPIRPEGARTYAVPALDFNLFGDDEQRSFLLGYPLYQSSPGDYRVDFSELHPVRDISRLIYQGIHLWADRPPVEIYQKITDRAHELLSEGEYLRFDDESWVYGPVPIDLRGIRCTMVEGQIVCVFHVIRGRSGNFFGYMYSDGPIEKWVDLEKGVVNHSLLRRKLGVSMVVRRISNNCYFVNHLLE
ncbi:MAG: hypothetical protein JJU11_02795 [Candidatus Sumerlaeia bacterium]|nr:hypothetical protein [Candidatus Sumerlaeia bacterium]